MRPIKFASALALVLVLSLALPGAALGSPGWRWPVSGRVITPYRNGGDPYAGGQHRGIDIAAPVGAGVVAAAGGRVTFAGLAGASGLTVAVRTADGAYDTAYLHLSAIRVRAGDAVGTGEAIGAVGTSGHRSADEPHLHFGVRRAGDRFAYIDPLTLLPPLEPGAPDLRGPRAVPVVAARPVAAAPAAVLPVSHALTGPSPAPHVAARRCRSAT